MIIDSGLQI